MTTALRELAVSSMPLRARAVDETTVALVARAQLGDVAALDRLLRIVQDPVYEHVAYIMRDADAAKDVLQTVLLTVCRTLIQLQDPLLLRAWVFRIATRAAVRELRRSRRREVTVLGSIPELRADDCEPLVDDELAASLRSLVEELPPACGIAVRLRYLEELSLAEVAEALDVPIGTVKSRLAYGIEVLRRRAVRSLGKGSES